MWASYRRGPSSGNGDPLILKPGNDRDVAISLQASVAAFWLPLAEDAVEGNEWRA